MAIRSVFLFALAFAFAERDADEHCDTESTAASVMMLQQTLSVQAVAMAVQTPMAAINARMQAALPVRFMHLQKTGGTSFFNAIFTLPGVCGGDEPPVLDQGENNGGSPMSDILEDCPGFLYEPRQPHPCLQPQLPDASGHFFGMFRQPEQRLISLHNHAFAREGLSTSGLPPSDFLVFFEHSRGGMVYQLTHNDPDESLCSRHLEEHHVVTDANVVEAVRVIQEDFVFVGITEHWDLSICLMHEMFGGDCTADEFVMSNPGIDPETGEERLSSMHDTSVLEGAIDAEDRILYEEALRIFHRNLEDFGVTAESCDQGCWAAARQ